MQAPLLSFEETKRNYGIRIAQERRRCKWLALLAIPVIAMNGACSSDAMSAVSGEVRQMQVSPELRDASYYAGAWTVTGSGSTCRIILSADRVESANAYALTDEASCLGRVLGRPVAGWRPATDGLDFAGSDRLSVGFFSFDGASAVLARPEGRLTLSRAR